MHRGRGGGRGERGGRGGGITPLEDISSRKRPRAGVLISPLSRDVYQMMIRQLHHDGYLAAASAVADSTGICVSDVNVNGDELTRLVAGGLAVNRQQCRAIRNFYAEQVVERYISAYKLYMPLHLSQSWSVGRKCFKMQERFVTASLDGVIRAVSFSPDGSFVSCCGTNGLAAIFSLKTIEDLCALEEVQAANRVKASAGSHGSGGAGSGTTASPGEGATAATGGGASTGKEASGTSAGTAAAVGAATAPISASFSNVNEITELSRARRFQEHTQSVEVMKFHPSESWLLTGGLDGDLYLRDYSHPNSTVQLKVHDNFPIRSAAYHPTAEYVLFGTDHVTPRLVNTRTGKIMTTPGSSYHSYSAGSSGGGGGGGSERLQHSAGLTCVDFSNDGRTLVTASLDGAWILYDGVSGKAIHRVEGAHSHVPVTSVLYSRSSQVLLTAGMDSTARLWDLRCLSASSAPATAPNVLNSRNSSEVMAFGDPAKCEHRSIHAVFAADESHVLCQDYTLFAIHSHCVYTGDTSYTLTTQPSSTQRGMACSPFSNLVVSGGDDCRLRLWSPSWLPS